MRHVFMDINDYQLTSPSWTAYVERPEYLYDDNLFNDYQYIFNRDIVIRSWERILDALQGIEDNIDTAYTWEDEALFGREITLNVARGVREALIQGSGDSQDAGPEAGAVSGKSGQYTSLYRAESGYGVYHLFPAVQHAVLGTNGFAGQSGGYTGDLSLCHTAFSGI